MGPKAAIIVLLLLSASLSLAQDQKITNTLSNAPSNAFSSLPVESFTSECPAYVNVEVSEHVIVGPVINYLSSNYPDLGGFVSSCKWTDDEFREELLGILAKDRGWKGACEKFSSYAYDCRRKGGESCERFDAAIDKCERVFEECKRGSDGLKETEEEIKRKLEELKKRYEEEQKRQGCSSDNECTALICPQVVGGDSPRCALKNGKCYCGGSCGDGYCDAFEQQYGCTADCQPKAFCGNGHCEAGETAENCQYDCVKKECPPVSCPDGTQIFGYYDPSYGCKYAPCPAETRCPEAYSCPDGSSAKCYKSAEGYCKCDPCPSVTTTTVASAYDCCYDTIGFACYPAPCKPFNTFPIKCSDPRCTTTTTQPGCTSYKCADGSYVKCYLSTTGACNCDPCPSTTTTLATAITTTTLVSTTTNSTPTGQAIQGEISQGIQQGIAQGIQAGIQQGLQAGMQQGLSQGFSQGLEGFAYPSYFGERPSCYTEELHCQKLREYKERCSNFMEKCRPNCDKLAGFGERCRSVLANEKELVERMLEAGKKMCRLRDYRLEVKEEKISEAEILPIIIVLEASVSESQLNEMYLTVESADKIGSAEDYAIYKGHIRANKMEELRKLGFVKAVKVDHIARSIQNKLKRQEFERAIEILHAPDEEISALEGVKSIVDETTAAIITDKEGDLLDASAKIVEIDKRVKGIGFRLFRFLGLKAKDELAEADTLDEQQASIEESAATLEKIAEVEDSIEAKTVLLEQAKSLREKTQSLKSLIEKKRKSARGLLSFLFGGE